MPRCGCDWKLSLGPADTFCRAQSIWHNASTSILRSLPPQVTWSISQPLPLAGLLGTSSPVPSATSDLLMSSQTVIKPIITTLSPTLFERRRSRGSQIRWDEQFLAQKTVVPSTTLSDFNPDEVPINQGGGLALPVYTIASCSKVPLWLLEWTSATDNNWQITIFNLHNFVERGLFIV